MQDPKVDASKEAAKAPAGAAAQPAPPAGDAASKAQAAVVDPATLTTYNKEAFLKVVAASDAALSIKLAAFDGVKAMTDLAAGPAGAQIANFFALVKGAKPYTALGRTQLNTIFLAIDFANQKLLFEAQFNIALSGTGGTTFNQAEVKTLYAQARLLPPNQVEGNPSFTKLVRGDGVAEGTHGGDTITMGAQAAAARYSQVFRHEVGHAVDDRLGGLSTDLRLTKAGWKDYGTIDEWITALGGYDTIPAALQATVKSAAVAFLGPGNTFTPPAAKFETMLLDQVKAAHPGVVVKADKTDDVSKDLKTLQDLFASNMLLKALIASQGTDPNYWHFSGWPEASSKVFFINHYYKKGYSLASTTWTSLKAWNNSSAAFSDKEWFAEVYADWYQNGVGGTHTAFPDYVTTFFTNTVDKMGAGATTPPPAATPAAPAAASEVVANAGAAQAGAEHTQAQPIPGAETGGAGGHPKVPRG